MSYAYMKILESVPERYDRGMHLLTLGRLERVYRDIGVCLKPGMKVLDLGCGTGALAVRLARQGCQVAGVDISPPMLTQAAQRLRAEGLEHKVELRELGATDLDDAFPDGSLDAVASTLVLSELSDDEIVYTLRECQRILRTRGKLLVADEVLPDCALGRVATFLFRLPFLVLAYVLTQNTTHRVAGLDGKIETAGFRILQVRCYLVGTLRLYIAEKAG